MRSLSPEPDRKHDINKDTIGSRKTGQHIKTIEATTTRRSVCKKKQHLKHRLSLSPICSVNACDETTAATVPNRSNSRYFDCLMCESRENIKNTKTMLSESRLPDNYDDPKTISIWDHKPVEKYSNRVLPQVRIAQFIQVLEKEIFPLKLLLNEIKYKCLSLGLLWTHNDTINTDTISCNTVSNSKRERQVTKFSKNQKNRVVYTIVFDE